MSATFVRRFHLRDSLNAKEIAEFWRFVVQEWVPAIQKVSGMRSVKFYVGAGGLRADLRMVLEMDHAGVAETVSALPGIYRFFAAMDMKTSTTQFLYELTPDRVIEPLRMLGG